MIIVAHRVEKLVAKRIIADDVAPDSVISVDMKDGRPVAVVKSVS